MAQLSSLPAVAHLAARAGAPVDAGRLVGAAERLRTHLAERERWVLEPVDQADWEWNSAAVRSALSPAAWEQALVEGRALADEETLALARRLLAGPGLDVEPA